jgi:hypothetical protein
MNPSITHPTDDERWMQSLHTVTPPRDRHACLIDDSPIDKEDTDLSCFSFDLVRPKQEGREATSQRKKGEIIDGATQEPHDDGDTIKTRRGELIKQCTVLYRRRQVSRAQQQFALLQRCFFPRRDVIKWIRRFGLSCEVLLLVQEPLTRLPCGANSTCVEMTYSTIMGFRVSFEDLNLMAGSLPLGEHVHTLYARPSVEGHYPVRFEIRNRKPGASGACIGTSPG